MPGKLADVKGSAGAKAPRLGAWGAWGRRHLLGLRGLSAPELRALLGAAREMSDAPGERADLRGRVVAGMFLEDSTRTRTSFALAARRLGAAVVDLSAAASSINKGETIIDTARTIEAMGVDVIVVRARFAGAAAMVAERVACAVVNAGDGRHEHPTQGLVDIYTLAQARARLEDFDLSGLRVVIAGDVGSSRVARSAIAGMGMLGAEVVCVGPPALAPASLAALGCRVAADFDGALGEADAVMMLRVQFERHGGGRIVSLREYRELYALTARRASRMKAGAVVMHPGPMNRGLEIDSEVAEGERSVILRQVANGVAVRMGVLREVVGAARRPVG